MKPTLVRYKTKPERAGENQRLIESVFAELQASGPEGLRYIALRLADDSFVHFVIPESAESGQVLPAIDSFKAFQKNLRDRCLDPPQPIEATIVGNYRMIED